MRKVVTALSSEDLEVNSPEHPSLDSLVQSLVEPRYLHHKDKEVRLHTVLACMEAFYLYAPSAPWDVDEILRIFAQIHAQLANLAHCTNASMPNYRNYFRLLSQLATVKVSIVLVELYNQGSGAALETLTELVHTLLHSMHREHPREVMNCASAAIAACIEEYEPSVSAQIPIPILDELLDVLSQGSTSTELVAVHTNASSNGGRKRSQAQAQVPQTVEAIRPAYALCKKILQRCEDRMSTPIVRLVNALLNHNAETLSKSKSILQQTRLHGDQAYRIIYELYRVTPNVLTEIIGNVASLLSSEDDEQRHRVIKLLGRLFYAPRNKYSANGNPTGSVNGNPTMAVQYESCFRDWCAHASDRSVEVRTSVLHCMLRLLKGNVLGSREQQHGNLKQVVEAAVMQSLKDKNCDVRMAAIRGLYVSFSFFVFSFLHLDLIKMLFHVKNLYAMSTIHRYFDSFLDNIQIGYPLSSFVMHHTIFPSKNSERRWPWQRLNIHPLPYFTPCQNALKVDTNRNASPPSQHLVNYTPNITCNQNTGSCFSPMMMTKTRMLQCWKKPLVYSDTAT